MRDQLSLLALPTGVALALALVAAAPARAEEPLWGAIASTLGKGFVNVTTTGAFRESKPYRHLGLPVLIQIERTQVVAAVEYGLTPDLDLHGRLPYFDQTIEESFAGDSISHPMSGLGEMEVGAKWRFWQAVTASHKDELALLLDLKLPTGDDELRDRSGGVITPHLQPNSGNLGAGIGLAANRHTPRGGYWVSGRFQAETASSRYHRGSMLELHGSAGWRLRPLKRADQTDWMGIAGLHYHRMGQEKEFGQRLPGTRGSLVSAELGVVAARRNLGARLGILLPIRTRIGDVHAPPRREIQASFRASF